MRDRMFVFGFPSLVGLSIKSWGGRVKKRRKTKATLQREKQAALRLERLREILQELDIETEDFEHPDVSLKHETEWCLSAFLSGLLIWENVGDASEDADPIPEDELVRHMKGVSRQKVLELWLKLAADDIAAVDAEPWLPGSH